MEAGNLSGSVFETICPGYNAEATLSLSCFIDSLKHPQASEPILVANHLKWHLVIVVRRQSESSSDSALVADVLCADAVKYPMTYSVVYTLQSKTGGRITSDMLIRAYEEPSFGSVSSWLISHSQLHRNYGIDGEVTVTANLNISLPICYNFNEPNSLSDVTIKIGAVSFPLIKNVLAVNSSFFKAMFFGSFKENHADEVTLKDVNVVDFVNILNVLFVRSFELKMRSVESVLKLADRFGILAIVDYCEKLLMKCELYGEPCLTERLVLATNYSLKNLQKRCLELCSSPEIIRMVRESPFYKDLHSDVNALLLDRMFEVLPNTHVPPKRVHWFNDLSQHD